MKIQLTLVFTVLATAASLADVGDGIHSFTTLSGRTYNGVLIAQVNPDGVLFRHAGGAGKVLFADLPGDIRQSLGYDAKKAEAHEKEQAGRRERLHLARIERDKEVAKAQATASAALASQAMALQSQIINASVVAQQSGASGWNSAWPVVWGYGGGYGWYNERIPSPSYGGRAYYTVRRKVGTTGFGPNYANFLSGKDSCHPSKALQPSNYSILAPATVHRGVPYSGSNYGRAAFTNGVPALNTSFVPSIKTLPHSPASGPVGRMAAPPARGR